MIENFVYMNEEETEDNLRTDVFLTSQFEDLSRASLKKRLLKLSINGKKGKLSQILKNGDEISIELQEVISEMDFSKPQDIPLDILYEDDDTIVINKPQGLVVHPAAGHPDGTMVNALVYLFQKEGVEPLPERAGIVHRLDKDTSGVILAAKSTAAVEFYSAQFADHSARKVYHAIVKGDVYPKTGRIETYQSRDRANRKRFKDSRDTSGKLAITDYEVISQFRGYAYVRMMPRTGRTHQLRVHFSGKGWPLLGDPIYSRKDNKFSQATLMLHAEKLEFTRKSDEERLKIRTELPERFEEILKVLKSEY